MTTRDDRKHRNPIARRKMTITAAASTSATVDMPVNGELLNYIIDAPALTTDTTFDFTITNVDGEVMYENTSIPDTVSTPVLLSAAPVPLAGVVTFTCSFSTSQTATFDIYLYYK